LIESCPNWGRTDVAKNGSLMPASPRASCGLAKTGLKERDMTRTKFETDRRGLIGGTFGTLITLAGVPEAVAGPAVTAPATIRKALPPRGSYGIVLPGVKRTAFLNAPAGMSPTAFRDHWISTYASGLRTGGAQSIIFNLIDHENSPDRRFDAVIEMFFDSDWVYEREYLGRDTKYSQEAEETMPSVVIVSRQVGFREFDPGRPMPTVKRFGVLRRKPELTTDTLALSWRDDHAPLFAANNYLRRYFIHLTDRTYAPDVPWDGYAEIWWDDFASIKLRSDIRVPEPESNASEVMYMFMTPKVLT
jgi:hypothetical protein